MKTQSRLLSFFLAFILVFGGLYLPAISASPDEATLTILPENGTPSSSSGTYNEMHAKLATELNSNPTVKTYYTLTLNTSADYTVWKQLNGNSNCYVTIDLNGYTLDVTNLKNNIYTIGAPITFTVDGADENGNRGLIHNDGICGAIAFVKGGVDPQVDVTVQNLVMYYTKMDQGYEFTTDQYPDQPMCNVGAGNLTVRNVKMTFTGENAVSGDPVNKPISKMTTRMIQFFGGGTLTVEDCEFYDTNTKGIQVYVFDVSNSSAVVKNTKINAYMPFRILSSSVLVEDSQIEAYLPIWNNKGSIQIYNCDITSQFATTQGNGTYIFNTTITADNGNIGDPSASHHQLHFMPSPEGDNIIYSSSDTLNGCVLPAGWQFVEVAEGKFVMQPDADLEATLVTTVTNGKASYATGSADSLIDKLKNISGVTTNTVYTLTLYENASLSTAKTITGNNYTSVIIDLNGFDLDVSNIANNIFTIYGAAESDTVGGINFTIDGADPTGTRYGKVTSTAIAGGLVYPRNENRNTNTVVVVKNLEMYYTNLSQGFCNTTSTYPNQPMFNLPKGDVILQNVKMTYTGEDATAVAGSQGSQTGNISDMRTPFINFGGKTLIIDGCEMTDTNTKDIQTRILAVSGSAKVYVKNSTFTAYLPIIANSGTSVFVSDSTLTAKNRVSDGASFVFDSKSDMYITDCVINAPYKLATSGSVNIRFVYGDGYNQIQSDSDLAGLGYKAEFSQPGYYFDTVKDGVSMMIEDPDVGATLAVYAEGSLPEFYTGSFNDLYKKLNAKPAVKTEYVLSLNQDATYTFSSVDTNSNAYILIDFNGHDFNAPGSNNIFQVTGNYHLTIDGKDRDGNISEVICTGTAGSLVYPRVNDGLNENSVIVISNLKMTYTNLSQAFSNTSPYNNQQIFHIPAGNITFNNVDMTYTGEDATTTDEVNKPLTSMVTDLVRIYGNATAVFNNCSVTDINTKGIPAKCLVVNGNANVVLNDCELNGGYTVSSATSGTVEVNGSNVTSSEVAYSGKNIVVTDSVTEIAGALSDNNPTLFMYGTGKNQIITPDGSMPEGNISVQDGYLLVRQSERTYIISDGEGYSSVRMPAIFQNGMVFQRNTPINVFGTCSANGAEISVQLGEITKQTTVSNGNWSVTFDPMEAAYGLTLTVTQSDVSEFSEPISITDVAIGEVWVVSGQSNAEYETYKMEDYQEYLENADNFNNIRAFIADHNTATQKSSGSGVWVKVNSDTLDKNNSLSKGDIPAIAYVMATRLATEFGSDVPIAIINASYNGTSIKTWISPDFYPEEQDRYSPDELDIYYGYKDFYDKNGRYPSSVKDSEYYTSSFKTITCGNYFGMLSFMEGYRVKGVLWYQGCTDTYFGDTYYTYLDALKKTMRTNFCDVELPVLVFQLHVSSWAGCDMLASQSKSSSDDQNCYLVSAFNEGTPFRQADYNADANYDACVFTHPSRKSPIGQRAADIALKNIYMIPDYENSGEPMVMTVTSDGKNLVLTFNQELCTEYDVAPTGFEIAGSDGIFYKAAAVLSGNVVTLSADEVSEPITVRYAFGDARIVLDDGTVIPYNQSISHDSTFTFSDTTIVTPDGTYVFSPDKENVIKTCFSGNLYGVSGHAVAIFKLDAGFVAA